MTDPGCNCDYGCCDCKTNRFPGASEIKSPEERYRLNTAKLLQKAEKRRAEMRKAGRLKDNE